MLRSVLSFAAAIVILLSTGGIDEIKAANPADYEFKSNSIKSLIQGIHSENEGLRQSAVFMAGKYKVRAAVLPLMAVLRKEPHPRIRVLAAASLAEIGDARGVFAISRKAFFEDDEFVKSRLNNIYLALSVK